MALYNSRETLLLLDVLDHLGPDAAQYSHISRFFTVVQTLPGRARELGLKYSKKLLTSTANRVQSPSCRTGFRSPIHHQTR